MDEIKEILKSWANEGNPAYDAIALIVKKLEELESKIQDKVE